MLRQMARASAVLAVVLMWGVTTPAGALTQENWEAAEHAIERGVAYLRQVQGDDGSWSPDPGPAVTALALRAMVKQPGISTDDEHVQRALEHVLSSVREDGGIYDQLLANYNTSIAVSALSAFTHDAQVRAVIADAQDFLRTLQWDVGDVDPQGNEVDEQHPFYGGTGYGNHGRPDLSNVQIMLQAMYDSGVDCDDPVYERAVAFISRLQGGEQNDMFDADVIEHDGGFIYATSVNADNVGIPQSMANPDMVERARQGQAVSGLRTYGSMTYAGFKSYLYADLDPEDPRVVDALSWIQHNYTLQVNPGMPEPIEHQGLYYYYHTFARAMSVWGQDTITTAGGEQRAWRDDLVEQLVALQREDGSWENEEDRWMEDDLNLVTAYAVLALTYAMQ